jgi:tRNA (guanosine-2'-O-)-methyltransferase
MQLETVQDLLKYDQVFVEGVGGVAPDRLIEALSPFITEERLNRIDRVISERTYNFSIVMENIYDRGNISAAMRSAEAFGFMNMHIIEKPDALFKAANRVTQGTDKWLDVQRYESARESLRTLKSKGYQVFATRLESDARPLAEVDFSLPTAIAFGNEKDGVSEELVKECDGCVVLPMYGFAQSFNISVAVALTCAQVHRARVDALGSSGDLTSHQKGLVKAHYILRSMDGAAAKLKEVLRRES